MKYITMFFMIIIHSTSYGEWKHSTNKDELTDQEINLSYNIGTEGSLLALRCVDLKFELMVSSPRYLSKKNIYAVYRIDKKPLVKSMWSVSNNGKIAISNNSISLAREISKGDKLLVELHNYKNVGYRYKFNISEGKNSITKILEKCKLNEEEIVVENKKLIKGFNEKMKSEVMNWNSDKVLLSKLILKSLKKYDSNMDHNFNEELTKALNKFYAEYLSSCKKCKDSPWRNRSLFNILYSKATGELKTRAEVVMLQSDRVIN